MFTLEKSASEVPFSITSSSGEKAPTPSKRIPMKKWLRTEEFAVEYLSSSRQVYTVLDEQRKVWQVPLWIGHLYGWLLEITLKVLLSHQKTLHHTND